MRTSPLKPTYFAIPNPIAIISKWFNPYRYECMVNLHDKPFQVQWTHRAQRKMQLRKHSLIVEMQLYFTCLVKKRVLFHDTYSQKTTRVNDVLSITFRPVEASSCDPIEFANNFPVKQSLTSNAARKMHPTQLNIDYKNGQWIGEYKFT